MASCVRRLSSTTRMRDFTVTIGRTSADDDGSFIGSSQPAGTVPRMDAFFRDARYALRSWRRAPGPIAAALAALALGIGATAAIFSVVAGVLVRPLPYQNPERLVMVWQDLRARGGPAKDWISPGLFVEWRQRASAFDRLAAVRGWGPTLAGFAEPEVLRGALVSSDYFSALGVPPAVGRVFEADDDRPNSAPVAIISDAL